MKRIGAVVGGIVVGVVVFAIGAGVVAALLAAIAQTGWPPQPSVSIALAILLDILKCGVAIWGGYRAYKYLTRKLVPAEAVKD